MLVCTNARRAISLETSKQWLDWLSMVRQLANIVLCKKGEQLLISLVERNINRQLWLTHCSRALLRLHLSACTFDWLLIDSLMFNGI